MTTNYRVAFFYQGNETPRAVAYVTAESPDDAHDRAIDTIRRQLPNEDLELFDQYAVTDVIWKTPFEGEVHVPLLCHGQSGQAKPE